MRYLFAETKTRSIGWVGVPMAALIAAVLMLSGGASGHIFPTGCNVNGLDLDVSASSPVVQRGDTVNFKVSVGNGPTANPAVAPNLDCDVTDANVTFAKPTAPSGSPGRRSRRSPLRPIIRPLTPGTNISYGPGFVAPETAGSMSFTVPTSGFTGTQLTGTASDLVHGAPETPADPDGTCVHVFGRQQQPEHQQGRHCRRGRCVADDHAGGGYEPGRHRSSVDDHGAFGERAPRLPARTRRRRPG